MAMGAAFAAAGFLSWADATPRELSAVATINIGQNAAFRICNMQFTICNLQLFSMRIAGPPVDERAAQPAGRVERVAGEEEQVGRLARFDGAMTYVQPQ